MAEANPQQNEQPQESEVEASSSGGNPQPRQEAGENEDPHVRGPQVTQRRIRDR